MIAKSPFDRVLKETGTMSQPLQPSTEAAVRKPEGRSPLSTIARSLLATGVLLGVIVFGVCSTGEYRLPFARHGDELSQRQIDDRIAAFNALAPIHLARVPEKDIPAAIESMQLSAAAKQMLEADLADQPHADNIPEASRQSIKPSRDNRLSLVWVSLWDTDAEDGDVVRIDSQGYSRTVLLKKTPMTFAIPVPADGIIKVTGIKDGEGGGITVGLASGTSKAVFPVMSEGQVLGLKVRLD
jgi:hypothetical protein